MNLVTIILSAIGAIFLLALIVLFIWLSKMTRMIKDLLIEFSVLTENYEEAFKTLSSKIEHSYGQLESDLKKVDSEIENIDQSLEDILEKKYRKEQEAEDLYEDARELVMEMGKCSTSMLQRKLKIGYSVAVRIVDQLEDEGIVGPQEGDKQREVFEK